MTTAEAAAAEESKLSWPPKDNKTKKVKKWGQPLSASGSPLLFPLFRIFFLVTVGDIITLLTLRHKCCYVMATIPPPPPTCALLKKGQNNEMRRRAGCDGCHHCYVNVTTFWLPPRWCVSVSCFMHNFRLPFASLVLCVSWFLKMLAADEMWPRKDNCLTISRRVDSTPLSLFPRIYISPAGTGTGTETGMCMCILNFPFMLF